MFAHHAVGRRRSLPSGLILAAGIAALVAAAPAFAATWTWTGLSGNNSWNNSGNWSPMVQPANNGTADIIFGNTPRLTPDLTLAWDVNSVTFNNTAGAYNLISTPNYRLIVSSINVDSAVTGVQSINLPGVPSGSLRFPTNPNTELPSLTITNNSTTAGTTLVIGANTVISPATTEVGYMEVTGVGTTEISGLYRDWGLFSAALLKSGPGTLILSNPANTYTRGTTVRGGKLVLGAGTAIPSNTTVDVFGGEGEFNIGSLSNSSATAIGRLSLEGEHALFRVPSGNGDYYIGFVDMWGSTIDFTGTTNFWLHLKGHPSNDGFFINGWDTTATWIGSGTSRIQNDSSVPMGIDVQAGTTPSGIDLDAGIILSSGTPGFSNPTFIKYGAGTMRLTNPGNTANINITAGKLRVEDMANLGSGVITLNGGTLQYSGPGATTTKSLTTSGAAIIQVSTPGADLNYNGVMNQSNFTNLYVLGPGAGSAPSTLTLNNNNSYSGAATVYNNAILAIPTIFDIGQPSPIGIDFFNVGISLGTSDSRGTLLLTGMSPAYSTNHKVTVNGLYVLGAGGAFGVESADSSLTLSGQITGSGSLIKTDLGTLFLSNTSNNYGGGTYVDAGRLHVNNDAALGAASVRINADGILRYNLNATVGRSIILAGGAVEAPAGISLAAAGVLQGTGTVVGNVANAGFVIPEDSTGVLHVQGNYTQASSGRLVLFADLLLPPGSNSKLDVTGDVALDGTLQMDLGAMGQFRGARSFDVLDWGGNLSGEFSTLQLPLFGGAFTWDTSQLYVTGVLTLTGPPLEGDYNNDGTVNAADYTVWRNNLGDATEQDINNAGDGLNGVDAADYTWWKQHYGDSLPGSGSGANPNAAVPEPASAMLLLLTFVIVGASVRGRSSRCGRGPEISSIKEHCHALDNSKTCCGSPSQCRGHGPLLGAGNERHGG